MEPVIIEKVKKHVKELFAEKYDTRSTYHSYKHTLEVAKAAEKIGKGSELNNDDLEIVLIAAWFHDTGYLFQRDDHESKSVHVAETFLKRIDYPDDKIQRVTSAILATRMGTVPSNLIEKVIHDADYINLANPDNLKQSELLLQESVNYGGAKPGKTEWLTSLHKFLVNQTFYTAYAQKKLEDRKKENIKRVKKLLKQLRKIEKLIDKPLNSMEEIKKDEIVQEKNAVKKKDELPVKNSDSDNPSNTSDYLRLHSIADRKANVMLILNGIIISITLCIVAADADFSPRLIIPTGILILVCLAALIFATLSTRPKMGDSQASNEKENKDFYWGMRKVFRDPDYLHQSVIREKNNPGKLLALKFRFLHICYSIFMYGIVASVLSVAVLLALGY